MRTSQPDHLRTIMLQFPSFTIISTIITTNALVLWDPLLIHRQKPSHWNGWISSSKWFAVTKNTEHIASLNRIHGWVPQPTAVILEEQLLRCPMFLRPCSWSHSKTHLEHLPGRCGTTHSVHSGLLVWAQFQHQAVDARGRTVHPKAHQLRHKKAHNIEGHILLKSAGLIEGWVYSRYLVSLVGSPVEVFSSN